MSELKKIATRDGFGEEILKLGLENPEILIVDADIGKSCKTGAFRKELSAEYHDDKNQYVNVGIAEQMQQVWQQDWQPVERFHL